MIKVTELDYKTRNILDDSFDDHDFVDTYDYNNEEEEECFEEEETEKDIENDVDDTPVDDDEIGDMQDESEEKDPSVKIEYGSVRGVRTYTDEEFDLEKANRMFYEGDEHDQMEALLYAQYYSRKMKRCKDAHNFIMTILTKNGNCCKSPAVYEQAQTSFYYFFRTYVLKQCQQFADRRMIPVHERDDFIAEALQTCHTYIFKALPGYDVDSGYALTTYFQPFIKDALTTWESQRKGRSSKSTMRTDAAVVNAQKELLEEGITPTAVLVAHRSHKKVEETRNSMSRIKAENTMVSSEANALTVGAHSQSTFIDPDKSYLKSEQTNMLIEGLKSLRPDYRKVLCYTLGVEFDEANNRIIDSENDALPIKKIAELMNLDTGEVKAMQVAAKRQFKTYVDTHNEVTLSENKTKDNFLHDRHMIFSSTKEDEDMMEIIGEIISISDETSADDSDVNEDLV